MSMGRRSVRRTLPKDVVETVSALPDPAGPLPTDSLLRRRAVRIGSGLLALGVVTAVGVPTIMTAAAANAEDPQRSAQAVAPDDQRKFDEWDMLEFLAQQKVASDQAATKSASAAAAIRAGKTSLSTAATLGTGNAAAPINARIVSSKYVLRLVRSHFPRREVGNAMAVAACESGQRSIQGDTNSDGTTDWGIFQLNDGGTLQGSLSAIGRAARDTRAAQIAAMNAAINVKAAAAIFRERGWSPWVCAYKQQIVAALYSNTPGPLAGKFTVVGVAMNDVPTKPATAKKPAPSKKPAPAKKPTAGKPSPTKPPAEIPETGPSADSAASSAATATADPTTTPSPTETTAAATEAATATP